jgi:nucleoside-diphosphate-sugar epimerase
MRWYKEWLSMTSLEYEKMPSKIVLIGGTGFIGSVICQDMKKKHSIFSISRTPPKCPIKDIHYLYGDWTSEDWKLSIPLVETDVCVILATPSHPSQLKADLASESKRYVSALNRLLLDFPAEIRLIFFSSIHVYGAKQSVPISEEQECKPISPYGKLKHALEKSISKRKNTWIFRPSQLVGPNPPKNSILWDWESNIRAGNSQILTGDLNLVRDFLHVSNVPGAIAHILREHPSDVHFNLCSGKGTSIRELATIMGIEKRCVTDSRFLRNNDVPFLVGNSNRLKHLGWKVVTPLTKISCNLLQ